MIQLVLKTISVLLVLSVTLSYLKYYQFIIINISF